MLNMKKIVIYAVGFIKKGSEKGSKRTEFHLRFNDFEPIFD